MADIVSDIDKVTTDDVAADAPLSEAFFEKLGANINGLIDRGLKFDQFTANGTWTCPEGVTEVLLIGCGGGGGGGGCAGGTRPGGQGGGGAPFGVRRASVTPTTVYTVTIGAGGAGGVGAANGQDGFPTTFVNFPSLSVQFNGGYGGAEFSTADREIKTKGVGAQGGGPSEQGGNSSGFAGGAGGPFATIAGANSFKLFGFQWAAGQTSYEGGGGGGAGPFGNGAAAAISSNPGQSASGASGAGGGGASNFGGTGGTGGAGGSGRLLVCYVG